MTDANYQRHLKALGKLCALFDAATASTAAANTLLATTADQFATGLVVDNPAVELLAQNLNSLQAAINSGPVAIQTQCVNIAASYLGLPLFISGLTTVPATSSAAAVLTALAAEMTTDTKTLTTKSGTGLINFFDTIAGTAGAWNSAADNVADYKDSIYVVSAVV